MIIPKVGPCKYCGHKTEIHHDGCRDILYEYCALCNACYHYGGPNPEQLVKRLTKQKLELINGIKLSDTIIRECVSFMDKQGLYKEECDKIKFLLKKYEALEGGE